MISYILFILMILLLFPIMYCYLYTNMYWMMLFKGLCSLCFLLSAWFGYKKLNIHKKPFTLMLIGLFFSFLGDILITTTSLNMYFILGIVFFLLTHIFFILAFIQFSPLKIKDLLFLIIFYLPLLFFMINSNIFKYYNLTYMVIAYSLFISFMLMKSFSILNNKHFKYCTLNLIVIGVFLFSFSDFILLFVFFSPYSNIVLKVINLVLYYIGQGLLALSFENQYYSNINI